MILLLALACAPAPDDSGTSLRACNGQTDLCDRPLDAVAFAMTHNAMYGPTRTSNLGEPSVAHTIGRILVNRSGIGTRLSESPTATSSAERGIAEAA